MCKFPDQQVCRGVGKDWMLGVGDRRCGEGGGGGCNMEAQVEWESMLGVGKLGSIGK